MVTSNSLLPANAPTAGVFQRLSFQVNNLGIKCTVLY